MNPALEQYTGQLLRYYDNPSNDARRTHEARWAWHYRHEYNKPGNWLRQTALALQRRLHLNGMQMVILPMQL